MVGHTGIVMSFQREKPITRIENRDGRTSGHDNDVIYKTEYSPSHRCGTAKYSPFAVIERSNANTPRRDNGVRHCGFRDRIDVICCNIFTTSTV
jgi:hypothetical protein